jgi:hypothetical protein
MDKNKKNNVGLMKRRRRSSVFSNSELVRISDGSFYFRKSPLPLADYSVISEGSQFPGSLNYEFSRRIVKKDVLQSLVYQINPGDKSKLNKLSAVKSSRTARYARRFQKSLDTDN